MKRRLNYGKSYLAFFKVGPAHDKNGPSVPGRTPDQSIKLSDLHGSYIAVNIFCRMYEGSDLNLHYRAPLSLPRFNFRGENKSMKENRHCFKNGARLSRYVPQVPTDSAHSSCAN
jgi:hypothetical protein